MGILRVSSPATQPSVQKTYDTRRYSVASFDQNLCLKPTLVLWASVLFLSRAVSLPLIIGNSRLGGASSDSTALVHGLFSATTLLPSAIAFLVLWVMLVRSPSAGRTVRWIFARGRILLVVSAVLDAGLTLAGVSWQRVESGDPQVAGALLGVLLDLYFLVYLLSARRVRDFFSDFPAAAN